MKSVCKIDNGGNKIWLNEKDKFHREDGPAVEHFSGTKKWYINGERHREDGPAIIYFNGIKEYWYHGRKVECYTDEEFLRLIKLKAFW